MLNDHLFRVAKLEWFIDPIAQQFERQKPLSSSQYTVILPRRSLALNKHTSGLLIADPAKKFALISKTLLTMTPRYFFRISSLMSESSKR